MKYKALITIVCLSLSNALAQEAEDIVSAFFHLLSDERHEEAVEGITATIKEGVERSKLVLQLKSKISGMSKALGKLHGADFISKKAVSVNLVSLAYLARFEQRPLRFEFVFYRPSDTWRLVKLTSNDIDANDLINQLREADGFEPRTEKGKKSPSL